MPTFSKRSAPLCHNTRIVKKLGPDQRGALRLARLYGDALVCVRYRHDAAGLRRYTTVELLVDEGPVNSPRTDTRPVELRIEQGEHALRKLAQAHGGRYNPTTKLWTMPRRLAHALGLLRRIAHE